MRAAVIPAAPFVGGQILPELNDELCLRGRAALVWVTGLVLARRKVRTRSSQSTSRWVWVTAMVTVLPAWTRPREIFCQATIISAAAEARRCTRTGASAGWGGGPAARVVARRHAVAA
jgi:hypothetical protein